jgi:hypothetical protein
MSTIHITNRKGNKLQLNGDLLTGDTFSMKDYIKSYMDGKWVADQKAWKVNVDKVNRLIEQSVLRIDDEPKATPAPYMSYEHFLRSANDPNSDY